MAKLPGLYSHCKQGNCWGNEYRFLSCGEEWPLIYLLLFFFFHRNYMKASDLFSGENVNPTAIFNAHHSYAPKLFRKNLNDLGLNSRYILTQEMEVQITPTGIFGPFAIRSVTIKDLQIFPGTIEWDYIW